MMHVSIWFKVGSFLQKIGSVFPKATAETIYRYLGVVPLRYCRFPTGALYKWVRATPIDYALGPRASAALPFPTPFTASFADSSI